MSTISRNSTAVATALLLAASFGTAAEETCNSPYVGSLIKGQEDYVYVWTRR